MLIAAIICIFLAVFFIYAFGDKEALDPTSPWLGQLLTLLVMLAAVIFFSIHFAGTTKGSSRAQYQLSHKMAYTILQTVNGTPMDTLAVVKSSDGRIKLIDFDRPVCRNYIYRIESTAMGSQATIFSPAPTSPEDICQ
jgi:hypothetical protein